MKSILRTDVGRVRKTNEDAAYSDKGLYIVCDGMGGHRAGDVAANMAADTIAAALQKKKPSVRMLLSTIAMTNERIYQYAAAEKRMNGMGTTLTMLWADETDVLLAQVGDSRAYLLRDGVLRQCTHDHSMVAELVRMGSITEAEARVHPHRNLITRALGTEKKVEPDIFELNRQRGDRWLLCSDGLTNHLDNAELQAFLEGRPLYEAADLMLRLALSRGGKDNVTILLLEDEGRDGQ